MIGSPTAGALPTDLEQQAWKTSAAGDNFGDKEFDELEKPLDDEDDEFGKKTPLPSEDDSKKSPPSAATIKSAMSAKIPDRILAEPVDDRVVTTVPSIPRRPLTEEMLFSKDDRRLPDLELLRTHFLREGKVTHGCVVRIIESASLVFRNEPNLLHLHDPITVCGDLHGQYYDMMRLLQVGGDPADVQYLFLGDYVDRGCFSCEVLLYLYAVKISHPHTFFMLRGNHECRHLTSFFNFRDECVFKYTIDLYNEFMESFDCLPLAATINEKFLCMHGGLSPDITVLNDINDIDRFREVPREGPMCDLLWSDPFDENLEHDGVGEDDSQASSSSVKQQNGDSPDAWFMYNETRQCSFVFGVSAVDSFLKKNHLTAVIRAHEAQLEGYRMQMQNKRGIPRIITIFSAPNYCDVYRNKGACLHFDDELLNIRQFMNCEHPYFLPNFMDVFSWSLPFVAEKVTDMLASVIGSNGDGSESDSDSEVESVAIKTSHTKSKLLAKRGGVLKEKVLAVTKLVRVYKMLREHNELVIQLKQLTPNRMVPQGLLSQGKEAIAAAVQDFTSAHSADLINERRPSFDGLPADLFDPKPSSQAGSKKNSIVDIGTKSFTM